MTSGGDARSVERFVPGRSPAGGTPDRGPSIHGWLSRAFPLQSSQERAARSQMRHVILQLEEAISVTASLEVKSLTISDRSFWLNRSFTQDLGTILAPKVLSLCSA
jgi:hypothetical protein